MDLRKYAQGQDFALNGSGCTSTATSIILTSMQFPSGTNITSTDIGSLAYGTLEPETEREENISFTSITQNANGTATLNGVTRGLRFNDPYDQDLTLRQAHAGGTTFRITNSAPFYSEFANKYNDETIVETWTFPNDSKTPVLGTVYAAPTLDLQIPSKKYVDDTVVFGAPVASPTTLGIVKIATAAADPANPIVVGTNDGNSGTIGAANKAVTQEGYQKGAEIYAASSAGTDDYVIALAPVLAAYTDGQRLYFQADVANTGAATLDAGPGAKALVKGTASVMVTGDIVAGGIYGVIYSAANDNFQVFTQLGTGSIPASILDAKGDLISATAADTPAVLTVGTNRHVLRANSATATGLEYSVAVERAFGATSRNLSTASGNQTIAHGMTNTPTFMRFKVVLSQVSSIGFSDGVSNGSSNNCVYATYTSGASVASSDSACVHISQAGADFQVATATADGTNITLAWTKTGSPTLTAFILWEASA